MRRSILFPLAILATMGHAACTPDSFELAISARLNDNVATLVEVSWETQDPGTSWVDYGTTSSMEMSTPTSHEASTLHSFELYALPPLSDVYIQVNTTLETGEMITGTTQISTSNCPSELPDLTVSTYDSTRAADLPYLMGVVEGTEASLFAIDREGNWLWYKAFPPHQMGVDLELSSNGEGFWYNSFGWPVGSSETSVTRQSLDTTVYDEYVVPAAHHDMALRDDGILALLVTEYMDLENPETGDEESIAGDSIQELSQDGTLETIFSAFDWSDPFPNDYWDETFYQGARDWTHANSLYYYGGTDTYLMSLGYLDTILEVSGSDGQVLRSFGSHGDYKATEEPSLSFQHDANWTDDDTLLCTTRWANQNVIGAVEYELDEESQTMTPIWTYGGDLDIQTFSQGQATRLDNGNTLVNFGSAGLLREVTPEGDVVWELQSAAANWFGNVRFIDDFYQIR